MADFIETSNTKSATRELANPIADVSTFQAIIQSIIDDNPFGCTAYVQNGASHAGVEKNRENYTAKVIYEDLAGDRVGQISAKAPTASAFNTVAASIVADTDLATAMGGDPVRDTEHDSYSCQLKCHDASSEIYYVTFSRDKVRISSYQDDSIMNTVETWADSVPALA